MRYTRVACGHGGGCIPCDPSPPATYHCSVCKGRSTMIPIEVQRTVLKYLETRDLKKDW